MVTPRARMNEWLIHTGMGGRGVVRAEPQQGDKMGFPESQGSC